MGGSAQLLLPFPSCTGIDNHCHLQKAQNATTSCPLSISVFYICILQIRFFGLRFLLYFKSPARKRTWTRGASLLEAWGATVGTVEGRLEKEDLSWLAVVGRSCCGVSVEVREAGDGACFGRYCWPVSGEGDQLLLWSGLFVAVEETKGEADVADEEGNATAGGLGFGGDL
jgi:hypothetical protein